MHGFVDAAGTWAVLPQFADADPFSENRAAVQVGGPIAPESDPDGVGRWGFVDPEGQLVIPAVYDAVEAFSCGLAPVARYRVEDDGQRALRWGFVDRAGTEVVPTIHRAVVPFGCVGSSE
ncbi:MAG: WG repeat-containing protein [Myxococcota bacterium]